MSVGYGVPRADRIHDICIVGGGPLGIAVARTCEELGLGVVMLEGGGAMPGVSAALPGYDSVAVEARHAPLGIAAAAALGGTSWWWGGRCSPLDAVDFMQRDYLVADGWPIEMEDVAPHYARAAQLLDCGGGGFEDAHAGWSGLGGGIRFDAIERWARTRQMAKTQGGHLAQSAGIDVRLGVAVVAIESRDGVVTGMITGDGAVVRARRIVLAGGGLGTMALLAGHAGTTCDGVLGRHYMGHLQGSIAEIVLADPDDAASGDFYLDETRTWVRRRFSIDAAAQIEAGIFNTVFWMDNPPFHDAGHRSGILSAVYLALCVPALGRRLVAEGIRLMHVGPGGDWWRHGRNVLARPLATLRDAWRIVRERCIEKPRRPGFLIRNRAGRYGLTYHGEQRPMRESAVVRGVDGRLGVDLRFGEGDAISIVAAHAMLDASLRAAGKGRLDYAGPVEGRVAAVMAQARDGFHQMGLLRMGNEPASSVVDRDCRVHGFDNLYVASTGVFATGGQASPTFAACALAVRLGHHLAREATHDGA